MSRIVRNALSLGSALLLAASLGATAFAAGPTNVQTASNTAVAVQSGAAVSGSATANGTGGPIATSGDATVTLVGAQTQSNVQKAVVAGISVASPTSTTTTPADTAQAAANTAVLTQAGVAVSGPAAAADGGTAKSGDATVGVFGEQAQQNKQVVADVALTAFSKDSTAAAPITIVQTADNTAVLDQSAAAVSGAASAAGTGATGWSGNVRATDASFQGQENEQAALNLAATLAGLRAGALAGTAAVQSASNQATIVQAVAAISGDAAAVGAGSWAWSGDADAVASAYQAQENEQALANIALAFGTDASVLVTTMSTQDAMNSAEIEQAAAATTGMATATGPGAWAFSGNAAATTAADQTQLLKQVVVNLGFGGGEVISIVDNTQAGDQLASVVPQDASAVTGPALTIGDGTTITGDVMTDEMMSQMQEGFQEAIYINGVLLP
jgi:hypothetical protein